MCRFMYLHGIMLILPTEQYFGTEFFLNLNRTSEWNTLILHEGLRTLHLSDLVEIALQVP